MRYFRIDFLKLFSDRSIFLYQDFKSQVVRLSIDGKFSHILEHTFAWFEYNSDFTDIILKINSN